MKTVPHIEDLPAVFALFESRIALELGVDAVRESGIPSASISTLFVYSTHTGSSEAGITIGGSLGWLDNVGVIALPGAGPFVSAGPLMSALAGIGTSGIHSGIVGTLSELGIAEEDARLFDSSVREGQFLIGVHCNDVETTHRVIGILETARAFDIVSTEGQVGDVPLEKPHRTLRL